MIFYDKKIGTAATNNLPDRFEDLPKHDIEIFQAECIQNVLDARSRSSKELNEPVEIDFILDEVGDAEIDLLMDTLGQSFFEKMRLSYHKSDSQDVRELMSKVIVNIEKREKWISLRIIEKNTTGLVGHEDPDRTIGERSKFDALLRSVNKTEKDEAISGGTFGKGSSVYTYSSGLWMWFAYSRLEEPFVNTRNPDSEDHITSTRFMGRGILAPFVDREQSCTYLGHQWFSRCDNALPFVNSAADELAEKFKLPVRKDNSFGTSYYIPIFQPDEDFELGVISMHQKFKTEIIRKWFIPIFGGDLICRVRSSKDEVDDVVIDHAYIKENVPELRYKLEILDWYKSNCLPRRTGFTKIEIQVDLPSIKANYESDYPYAKELSTGINHLIIREIKEEGEGFVGFNTVNRVALTRNLGMIINHYPYLNDSSDKDDNPLTQYLGEKKFEAVLFMGRMCNTDQPDDRKKHMDLFISLAENPAHNMLISNERELNRCRLNRFNKNPVPFPWNRISKLLSRIELEIRKAFPKEDAIPVKKDICNFWKKLAHIQKSGPANVGERTFHYRVINEGFLDGKYYWDLSVESIIGSRYIVLTVESYLDSLEQGKEKDFDTLGIPEFSKLLIEWNKSLLTEIRLEPKEKKRIRLVTCDIVNNELFKNYRPIIELKDNQPSYDSSEVQD